jgi:hypothetical protein
MIREKLIDKGIGDNKKFRWRSNEISRIEGLSDGVFAFAVTLLVISLEVPLCPIVLTIHGTLMGRRRRKLEEQFGSIENAVLESN